MVTLWNFDIYVKLKVMRICASGNYAYKWIVNSMDTAFSYVLETLKLARNVTLQAVDSIHIPDTVQL